MFTSGAHLARVEMRSCCAPMMPFCAIYCLLGRLVTADVGACPGNTTADEMTAGFNLSEKVAVVTGGDSGLGFAIAKAFAHRGARVIIGSHNVTKGNEAAERIMDMTGSDVLSLHVDYESLASVHEFARHVFTESPMLHFLVNDAGIRSDPKKLTEDGFDAAFQVNYLGHFLLTELLLPLLRASSPSRVISTSGSLESRACEFAGWPRDCLRDWSYLPPPVIANHNLSSSVMAIFLKIQHAAELAYREKLSGIEAFSFEPGLAITPLTEAMNLSKACADMRPPHQEPCPYTADQAVSVALFCALHDVRSGGYFSRTLGCNEGNVGMNGFTEDMRPELYRRSLEWSAIAKKSESIVSV
eukprot:TRINITY_DN66459_c0_g1_i1.p1 TRINITY_DN66459_c0_g1~~TRINITY_DN66459_c0_g1_i1.p1  ORF type:complete len:357 (-),score=51.59 TRINITY_DN66459_c0_g1_i1:24-1094(-)